MRINLHIEQEKKNKQNFVQSTVLHFYNLPLFYIAYIQKIVTQGYTRQNESGEKKMDVVV